MQFIHRISIASSHLVRAELADLGIDVDAKGLVTFEVDESQESWPELKHWIAARRASDFVSTKFSRQELADASWLELIPSWHHGYPQPKDDEFGYRAATYDLSDFCPECGAGLRQCAPFQMKAEPKWGRNEILQLNWVFDEFFVTPDLWARTFEPLGIGRREVLNVKGKELLSVVQLVVKEEIDIIPDGLDTERCAQCKRVRFIPVMRGTFSALVNEPKGHIARIAQYFGSGAMASNGIVISRTLANAMAGVRGATLRPVGKISTLHLASS